MPTSTFIASAYPKFRATCSTCIHYRDFGRIFNDSRPAGQCQILKVYVHSTRMPPCYDLYYVDRRYRYSDSDSDSE